MFIRDDPRKLLCVRSSLLTRPRMANHREAHSSWLLPASAAQDGLPECAALGDLGVQYPEVGLASSWLVSNS